MIDAIKKDKCTGCKVCETICPKNAISMEVNSEGFWYPVYDNDACSKCGACVKNCPQNEIDKKQKGLELIFAAWSKDDKIRRDSTSGGVYWELANYMLGEGGYIAGSVYENDFKGAFHIVTNKKEDLERIKGSKYFQSDSGKVFEDIKKLVVAGEKVLFTGSPCQVQSLKKYLVNDYENLYTIDFICRGVPSPLLQKKKIELYEKEYHSEVVNYRDKSKKVGWVYFGELINLKNGKEKFINHWDDMINNCFIEKNLNLRESCYTCQIKDGYSYADITLGDFWGIKGVTSRDERFGVSSLIVNSTKGCELLDRIGDRLYTDRRSKEELIEFNSAYVKAPNKPAEREDFFECIEKNGLKKAVKKYSDRGVVEWLRRKKRRYANTYKRVYPIIRYWWNVNWSQFIYYNFICRKIVREKGSYLIPWRGTNIQIGKGAHIVLKGDTYLNYYPVYKKGKYQTTFRVGNNAELNINNGLRIAYNNTFSIDHGCRMNTGYLFTGVGTSVICSCEMELGNNIMLGRDVCIFDSDYHSIFNEAYEKVNPPKKVVIEDNVWIGAKSIVLKGAHIEKGAIVSANSMVLGNVEANRCFINVRESKSVGKNIYWKV